MARWQAGTAAAKYIVKNGISFPRPGRPATGPGSKDEVHLEPSDVPQEIPAEYVAGYLLAEPGRPADIELADQASAPAPVAVPDPAPEAPPAA